MLWWWNKSSYFFFFNFQSSSGSSTGVRPPSTSMRFQSGLRPPTKTVKTSNSGAAAAGGGAASRIARPMTGIPRPGSRLPAPSGSMNSTGIPKPNSNPGSRNGSRASSAVRKTSMYYWKEKRERERKQNTYNNKSSTTPYFNFKQEKSVLKSNQERRPKSVIKKMNYCYFGLEQK